MLMTLGDEDFISSGIRAVVSLNGTSTLIAKVLSHDSIGYSPSCGRVMPAQFNNTSSFPYVFWISSKTIAGEVSFVKFIVR